MDLRVQASSGHMPEMLLEGPGGVAYSPDRSPGVVSQNWHHFSIPVTKDMWQMRSGTWEALLPNITSLLLSLDIVGGGPLDGNVDNFALIGNSSDLVATSLTLSPTQSGVNYSYDISGSDLSAPAAAGLYWSADNTFDAADTLAYSFNTATAVGSYGPTFVSAANLGAAPVGATHLILALDPANQVSESSETNNTAGLELSNIHVTAATTDDSKSVKLSYTIEGASLSPFAVKVYRSTDAIRSDDDMEVPLQSATAPGTAGDHTGSNSVKLDLQSPLKIDPSHPYILVVADRDATIMETNEDDNQGQFRKRVIGVTTNGLQPIGGFASLFSSYWIRNLARSLRTDEGYDVAFDVDWSALSNRPVPGITYLVADNLATQVNHELFRLKLANPDDIIDVHLIGHSRGAVVISLAANMLASNSEVTRGTLKLTLLDPHPAFNYPTEYFDHSQDLIGRIARVAVIGFQALARDPSISIPSNVDYAENFFQHTLAIDTPTIAEQVMNLWGSVPVSSQAEVYTRRDLTGPGMSHTKVVDWYLQHVVDSLGTGGDWNGSGDGGGGALPLRSGPAVSAPVSEGKARKAIADLNERVRTMLPASLRNSRRWPAPTSPAAEPLRRVAAAIATPDFWHGESAIQWY